MATTHKKIEIRTEAAPAPVGPYSQAIRMGDVVFLSGQIPLDPQTGKLVPGEIEDETRQVLKNLRAVLEASGSALSRVVKTTVYLTDMRLFPRVNAIYAEVFRRRVKNPTIGNHAGRVTEPGRVPERPNLSRCLIS